MTKYVFILKQEGYGCDYTIGCGINYTTVEADNIDEALEKFIKRESENYLDDTSLRYMKVFEVSQEYTWDKPRFKELPDCDDDNWEFFIETVKIYAKRFMQKVMIR